MNPYAANVNDILHQSFFLKDAFMGEFSLRRIGNLVSEIDNCKTQRGVRTAEELKKEIELVGRQIPAPATYDAFDFQTKLR